MTTPLGHITGARAIVQPVAQYLATTDEYNPHTQAALQLTYSLLGITDLTGIAPVCGPLEGLAHVRKLQEALASAVKLYAGGMFLDGDHTAEELALASGLPLEFFGNRD